MIRTREKTVIRPTVFALIEQPRLGWSNPAVSGSL